MKLDPTKMKDWQVAEAAEANLKPAATLLKGEGFPVARRTVAKYRALAGIPGTSARRVF